MAGRDGREAGIAEQVQGHVAASLDPFAGLFSEYGADEVGASADSLAQGFLRITRPDLAPELTREAGQRQEVLGGATDQP